MNDMEKKKSIPVDGDAQRLAMAQKLGAKYTVNIARRMRLGAEFREPPPVK